MPEQERIDRLAYDLYRQDTIKALMDMKGKDGKLLTDVGAFVALKMEQI